MSFVYKNDRPFLTVEITDKIKLGRCYYGTKILVTCTQKLSKDKLTQLRLAGALGAYGQEFYIHSQCDGDEEPAGYDEVPCIDEKTGEKALNPRTGKVYPNHRQPFFQYRVEHRVDSSD